MTLQEYKQKFDKEDAVGWDAIDGLLKQIYPKQEPVHYPSKLPMMVGGEEPLHGVSIYRSKKQSPHFHYVSYGMSELFYNEEAVGQEFSKWGFEFTCRIAITANQETPPSWVIALMNHLGRYVYNSQRWFEENHVIPLKAFGIHTHDLVAIAFSEDAELHTIDTPHGTVSFLQMVGLDETAFARLPSVPTTDDVATLLIELKKENPLLIFDASKIELS